MHVILKSCWLWLEFLMSYLLLPVPGLLPMQGQKAASQLKAVYVLQDQVLKAGLEW
jgi:hypothetical protein